jgi:hypothetical protein
VTRPSAHVWRFSPPTSPPGGRWTSQVKRRPRLKGVVGPVANQIGLSPLGTGVCGVRWWKTKGGEHRCSTTGFIS